MTMAAPIPFWTLQGDIDLAALRPMDVRLDILADTLAKANRFSGRTAFPWSVAAHSVLVDHLVAPEYGPWALLHDAHEAFLGDITMPAVELIEQCAQLPGFVTDALSHAKGRIDRVIGTAWHVSVLSMTTTIRHADRIALMAEAIVMLGARPRIMTPGDEDEIDRAISLLMELPRDGDWRIARDLWVGRVEHYAQLGRMHPPRMPNPAGGQPAYL